MSEPQSPEGRDLDWTFPASANEPATLQALLTGKSQYIEQLLAEKEQLADALKVRDSAVERLATQLNEQSKELRTAKINLGQCVARNEEVVNLVNEQGDTFMCASLILEGHQNGRVDEEQALRMLRTLFENYPE